MHRGHLTTILACAALAGCGRFGFDARACPDSLVDADGLGTADAPFRLCAASQVAELAGQTELLDAHVVLTEDLDFAGVAFAGIGTMEAPFTGFFDGNGYRIKNLDVAGAPGQPAGLFAVTAAAHIEDVTLDAPVVAGSEDVGALVGYCDTSQVRTITITDADVRGETGVGGLVGEAAECHVIGANLSGVVQGTVEAVGGIAGAAGSSSFMNIETTVDVEAPLASGVGGIVGKDNWSPVIVQHVTARAKVVGNQDVGGLVGYNGDGSQIYRTQFEGTVRGNVGVGGFAGGNYDSPFLVYSSSVVADVTGSDGVGGFSGKHYYRTNFYDSYFKGTLTGVGSSQRAFGGFFGDVEYYGWVERSYVDVTVDSRAATVGGVIGYIGYWSGDAATYDIARSFSAANVTGQSGTATVSLWVGQNVDPNPFTGAGTYYWAGGSCTNLAGGGCGSGGASVPDRAAFQSPASVPLSTWDFDRVWRSNPGAFPTLRLEQSSAPIVAGSCNADVIAELPYGCDLMIEDGDVNERRIALRDRSTTCDWLGVGVDALYGTPAFGDAGTCTMAFTVTDGTHTTELQTFEIAVHRGVLVSPTDQSSRTSHQFGSYSAGSAPVTKLYTLTNFDNVTATALSIGNLPTDGFAFAGGAYPGTGGSCGATLGAGQSCTVAITFTPLSQGIRSAPLAIRFTTSGGPLEYTFALLAFVN